MSTPDKNCRSTQSRANGSKVPDAAFRLRQLLTRPPSSAAVAPAARHVATLRAIMPDEARPYPRGVIWGRHRA